MPKLLHFIQKILGGLFIMAIISNTLLFFLSQDLGIHFFLLISAMIIFIPLFIVSIFYGLLFRQSFKKWADILKKRDSSHEEAEEVFLAIRKFPKVPNTPANWGYCKQIYYGVLHSREVNHETKLKIFNKFDELDVHGIRAPRR